MINISFSIYVIMDIYIPIFLINRKEHKKRLEGCLRELKKINSQAIQIVQAHDGKYAQEQKFSYFSSRVYKNITRGPSNTSIIPTWEAAACAISHIKAWKYALESKEEIVIICEDDITVKSIEMSTFYILEAQHLLKQNPLSILFFNGYIKTIQGQYFYFNSKTTFAHDNKDSYSRLYNNTHYCITRSHFYMTTKTALKKMLEHNYPIEYQIDIHMSNVLRDRCELSIYNATEDCGIFQNKKFLSTVQFYNIKNPNYLSMILKHKLPFSVCECIVEYISSP